MSAEADVPPGYKRTEVGVIPEDWEARPLLEAVDISSGQVDPRTVPYRSYMLVAPDHIESATGRLNTRRTATEQNAISGKYRVYPGDIVYSKIRPYLRKAILANFEGLCSADMYPMRPRGDVCSEFLLPILLGYDFTEFAETVSARSGIPKINREELAQYKFALPPLPEQDAIAGVLSNVDELNERLERLIAKKHKIKQAAMQQLLTGKSRLPGFSGEWENKRLGDLLVVRHGKSQKQIETPAGRYPILATSGEIGRSDEYLYNKPSVLIGRKGTIDQPQFINGPFWTIDTLFFTEINNSADPKFLFYKFSMIHWNSYNEASGVPSLSSATIEAIEVLVPDIDEQEAITTVLSDMDAGITALEAKRNKVQQIKQGMMQELLTGRKRLI